MVTAVDANVLLDVLIGVGEELSIAHSALAVADQAGAIVISAVGYAEVAQRFRSRDKADEFFTLLGCSIEPFDTETAFLAGQFAREYRQRGGTRTRILPDFLIAAHAQLRADRLLTRDNRFFRATFPRLNAVSPTDMI